MTSRDGSPEEVDAKLEYTKSWLKGVGGFWHKIWLDISYLYPFPLYARLMARFRGFRDQRSGFFKLLLTAVALVFNLPVSVPRFLCQALTGWPILPVSLFADSMRNINRTLHGKDKGSNTFISSYKALEKNSYDDSKIRIYKISCDRVFAFSKRLAIYTSGIFLPGCFFLMEKYKEDKSKKQWMLSFLFKALIYLPAYANAALLCAVMAPVTLFIDSTLAVRKVMSLDDDPRSTHWDPDAHGTQLKLSYAKENSTVGEKIRNLPKNSYVFCKRANLYLSNITVPGYIPKMGKYWADNYNGRVKSFFLFISKAPVFLPGMVVGRVLEAVTKLSLLPPLTAVGAFKVTKDTVKPAVTSKVVVPVARQAKKAVESTYGSLGKLLSIGEKLGNDAASSSVNLSQADGVSKDFDVGYQSPAAFPPPPSP